jgi:hypothetical protein
MRKQCCNIKNKKECGVVARKNLLVQQLDVEAARVHMYCPLQEL